MIDNKKRKQNKTGTLSLRFMRPKQRTSSSFFNLFNLLYFYTNKEKGFHFPIYFFCCALCRILQTLYFNIKKMMAAASE